MLDIFSKSNLLLDTSIETEPEDLEICELPDSLESADSSTL